MFCEKVVEIEYDHKNHNQRMEKRGQKSESDYFHITMHFMNGFFEKVLKHMLYVIKTSGHSSFFALVSKLESRKQNNNIFYEFTDFNDIIWKYK